MAQILPQPVAAMQSSTWRTQIQVVGLCSLPSAGASAHQFQNQPRISYFTVCIFCSYSLNSFGKIGYTHTKSKTSRYKFKKEFSRKFYFFLMYYCYAKPKENKGNLLSKTKSVYADTMMSFFLYVRCRVESHKCN